MKISNISKSYPESNFSLEVKTLNLVGNINVIIGENGSGKSVLLKEVMKMSSAVLLLQNPYIFNKKVYKTLEFIKKVSNSTLDVNEVLEMVNLNDQSNYNSLSLSGGQKQRLAFAMIIMSEKDFILLDEPFNGIDVYSQKLIVDLIKKMNNKKFVIVTHKLNHAKSFGDNFIFMEKGKIMWEGDKQTFFTNELVNEFVLYE
ncbi:MAG: ATP-binding cassette domain-containing protein [Bacilli bacterium]